ncbi:MAG: InlB B-repeat-containing protein, partial [Prevotella sp.]|nr:InlB B-repeat-containing protein [Prevotella sp.]
EITFSTTESTHTLRLFSEFTGWFNFYLDDLILVEEDTYRPELAPVFNGPDYLAFGKSTGTSSTDVEVQYIKVDNTGAYAPTAIPEKEVVFYYPFDDDILDYSGNLYNPTSPNGNAYAPGLSGKALSLDGVSQYLDLSVPNLVNPSTTPHTFAMWLYNSSTATVNTPAETSGFYEEVAVSQKDNTGTGRLAVFAAYDAAVPTQSTYTNLYGNVRNTTSLGAFERNKWTHVALVADPATKTIKWYINGELDNTVIAANAFETTIGGYRIGTHKNLKCYWTGLIDDLYLVKGQLTADEIKTLYKESLPDYTVSFESNGGSAVESQTVTMNDPAAEPVAPKRAGYTFDGWYSDSGLTTPYVFADLVVGNITLYAKWTADPSYKETFLIDFGQDNAGDHRHLTTGVDANGNVWNNAVAPNGSPSTLMAGYSISLLNAQGASTSLTLTVKRDISSNGGGNGGLYTPPSSLGDLAIESATEDYFFLNGNDGKFSITGFDPTKTYKFTIFGTRINSSGANRVAIYSLYGANGSHGTLINADNTGNVWVSGPVKPSASGEILLAMGRLYDGEMAYIGAMKFEEVTDVIPAADRNFYIDFGKNNAGLDGDLTANPDANGNYWNNMYSNGNGATNTAFNPSITLIDADNSDAAAYTLDLGSTVEWNGVRNGALGGTDSPTEPNASLLGDLAIKTATYDYLFINNATAVLTFGNLKTTNQFRFNVFGCRTDASANGRIGRINLAGATSVTGIHQMGGAGIGASGEDYNNNRIFVSDLIAPDASGEITLTMTQWFGMSHINCIKLEEIGDVSTGLSSVVLKGLNVYSFNKALTVSVSEPAAVSIYTLAGTLVASANVESSKTFSLPAGAYLVKSLSATGEVSVAKALNK